MILLDTHLLIWASRSPERLSRTVVETMSNPQGRCWFSMATVWETGIKYALGRSDFPTHPEEIRSGYLQLGFSELPIKSEHVTAVVQLPHIHRDPFDRMLIAQARSEGMRFLTADKELIDYGPPVEIV